MPVGGSTPGPAAMARAVSNGGKMEEHDDLVIDLRAAARVGDDRGVLEWRQLLERAAVEISQLRSQLHDTKLHDRE
jgi:hypothetical protein